MTLNKLASVVAKREGKKSQVAIGNIREILKILAALEYEHYHDDKELLEYSPSIFLTEQVEIRLAKQRKKAKRGK